MDTIIKLKRGQRDDLPIEGLSGEPFVCMDTRELFVGNGEGNPLIKIAGDSLLTSINYAEFKLNANQSIPNVTPTLISWSNIVKDDYELWSSLQPTRFTIPMGINLTRISLIAHMQNITANRLSYIELLKNNLVIYLFEYSHTQGLGSTDRSFHLISKILEVSQNDYFQVRIYHDSGGARNLLTTYTYCQLEVWE